jgi:hypothetical protein
VVLKIFGEKRKLKAIKINTMGTFTPVTLILDTISELPFCPILQYILLNIYNLYQEHNNVEYLIYYNVAFRKTSVNISLF